MNPSAGKSSHSYIAAYFRCCAASSTGSPLSRSQSLSFAASATTSLSVKGSKARPCSKHRTLLFQRLELRRRVRHMTVGRQFPIDRNRSSPKSSLIYYLQIIQQKKINRSLKDPCPINWKWTFYLPNVTAVCRAPHPMEVTLTSSDENGAALSNSLGSDWMLTYSTVSLLSGVDKMGETRDHQTFWG